MADPFTFPDPFGDLADPFARVGGHRRAQAAYPPLGEADTETAIQGLTHATLSGLGYVGSELDKLFGDRAIRGVLAGKPREVLSLIPGSDLVGLTNEADTTRGEDLFRQWGYDPSKGNWLERNLAGPVLEAAISPSMYLGGIGALTAAGKAAEKTGTLTRGFLPSIAKGERTLMHGLTGQGAADFAGGAADVGRKALQTANVGIRKVPGVGGLAGAAIDTTGDLATQARLVARTLFDKKAGFLPHAIAQNVHEFDVVPFQRAQTVAAKQRYAERKSTMQPLLEAGASPEDVARYQTAKREGVPNAPQYLAHATAALPANARAVIDADIAASQAGNDAQRVAELAAGAKSPKQRSNFGIGYGTRQSLSALREASPTLEKLFPVGNASMKRRLPGLDVPGGTLQSGDWMQDAAFAGELGLAATDRKAAIERVMDDVFLPPFGGRAVIDQLDPRFVKGLTQRAEQFADIAAKHDPKLPFWNPDFIAMDMLRDKRSTRTLSGAKGAYGVIGQAPKGAKGVPVPTVLYKAGLTGPPALGNAWDAMKRAAPDQGVALQQDLNDFMTTAVMNGAPNDPIKLFADFMKTQKMAEPDAQAAASLFQRFNVPAEIRVPRFWGDSLLNLFKTGAYSIWPASHGRNALSGGVENAVFGDVLGGGSLLGANYPKARQMRNAPTPADLPGLHEAFAHGIIGTPQGEANQALGIRMPDVSTGNPSLPQPSLREIGQETLQGLKTAEGRNPLNVTGVGGRIEDKNALAHGGRQMGTTIEDNLRLGQFLDLKARGFTPEAAAAKVMETHFDYNSLTDFERDWMKRLIPFYTFTRRNVPKQIQRAIQSPGKIATPIRLAGRLQEDEGYVPEYLQSGLGIPMGEGTEGTQRYLSQLGLPFEEAFGRLKVGKTPWETTWKTAEGLLGMLRPEIKMALENATGKQFFTGRELADLHPGKVASLGGLLDEDTARPIAQVLANTPATRMISTFDRLMDERKGLLTKALSLTTGAKITDVDVQKWRAIDARHNLEDLLHSSPGIRQSTDYYPTAEAKATHALTPEQEAELRVYASLKLRARQAAEAKRRVGVQLGGG